MKKRLAVLSVLFLIFSLFLTPVFSQAQQAVVTHVEGSPQLTREGKAAPLEVGSVCQKSDLIKTADGCVVDIALNQTAGCRLLPGTEVYLTNTEINSMHLKVNQGNVVLNLDKLPKNSTFKIETPTAVAAARGTQFWGRVDKLAAGSDLVTTFAVREGVVDVTALAANRAFTLNAGDALDIPLDSTQKPAVRKALDGEMAAMEQASLIKTRS